jgi:WD40 repeat protein
MSADAPTPPDDEFADLLAACDEALAAEVAPPAAGDVGAPAELQPRLERGLRCLRRLQELRPGRPAEPPTHQAGQPPPPPPTLPLKHVGRFLIERELGRGGFGVVYLAHDPQLGRPVALKVPHAHALDDADARARFRREAEAAAGLQHPNLMQVYEAGEDGPVAFIVLAYCPGVTLADWLHDCTEPVPVADAARLVATLAAAVDHAHRHGIVHRDLKPANVILQIADCKLQIERPDRAAFQSAICNLQSAIPRITDFGLAKHLDGRSAHTRTGAIVGTPCYMAPEQAGTGGTAVGPAADVYSLGAVLYQVLTGRPPFVGETVLDTLQQVRFQEPLPPRRLRPGLPRDLETVCLKCLDKQPERRYATAQALADDLGRYLDGRPIHARPIGPAGRLLKWARRRPAVATALALAGAAAALLLAVLVDSDVRIRHEQQETERAYRNEKQAYQGEKKAREDLTKVVARERQTKYLFGIRAARAAWLEGNLPQAEGYLEALRPEPGQDDLRAWEWHFLKRLCYQEPITFRGHSADIAAVAYSPDGKRVASGGRQLNGHLHLGVVRVWDPDTHKVALTLLGHERPVMAVAWSPDGSVLASASEDETIRLWDATTGATLHVLQGHKQTVRGIAFHPSGKRLASVGADYVVRIWDVAEGKAVLSFREDPKVNYVINAVAFSPDGTTLATGGSSRVVKVWDAATGKELYRLGPHQGPVFSVAFRPGGKQLASAGHDRTVRVWDLATRAVVFTLRGHAHALHAVAFTPDGTALASGGGESGTGEVWLWDAATGAPKWAYRGHRHPVTSLTFRRDGRRLASASTDATVKVWDATGDPEAGTIAGTGAHLAFSPDGKHVAALFVVKRYPQGVKLWDAATRVEHAALLPDATNAVAYSRDGKRLAAVRTGLLRLWDPGAQRFLTEMDTRAAVHDLCFSPDGASLALTLTNDNRIPVWDVATGKVRLTITGPTRNVRRVRYSPDGRLLLAAGDDRAARLWDATTGALVRVLEGDDGQVDDADFSNDGRLVATVTRKQAIHLWDAASGELVRTLRGHNHWVTSVAFSPDGRRLASGGSDRAVKLWDVATGQELLTLHQPVSAGVPGHSARPERLAFSPDGRRLAATYDDFTLRLWDATPLGEP